MNDQNSTAPGIVVVFDELAGEVDQLTLDASVSAQEITDAVQAAVQAAGYTPAEVRVDVAAATAIVLSSSVGALDVASLSGPGIGSGTPDPEHVAMAQLARVAAEDLDRTVLRRVRRCLARAVRTAEGPLPAEVHEALTVLRAWASLDGVQ